MGASVVVGGFFGDEAKGKVVAYLSLVDSPDLCVRTGAPNAGHTVVVDGTSIVLRSVPSCFVNKSTRLSVAPGALINVKVFLAEVEKTRFTYLDYSTGVIEDRHVEAEKSDEYLIRVIGSTGSGVGYAMAERVLRKLKLARDYPQLQKFLTDVPAMVNDVVDSGGSVIIEGSQGTFLSLYHGTYPYVTSRDTTAAGIISEVGISPRKVSDVILVFKAFVTRVGSGPLPGELSSDEVERLGWVERGSVTGRPRRAAPFNMELARRSVMLNSPTQIAITKLDALFPEARGRTRWDELPVEARRWIEQLMDELKVPITLIGTGPDVRDMVDLRREYGLA